MVSSDSVSECPVPTHSATKFKSFMDFCVGFVHGNVSISGVFVLVIFDSLLKEFHGLMGQL